MIDLWPNEPFHSSGVTDAATREVLFPSGRQAVLRAVEQFEGRRDRKIALPEFSSHCLISAVAKKITPLPISAALNKPTDVDIVLLYSQWGWERPIEQLVAAMGVFTKASFILDRVDSLCHSLAKLPKRYADQSVLQVFSLNKLLGLGGGGLVAIEDRWLKAERGPSAEERLGRELYELKTRLGASPLVDMIHGWEMADLRALTPGLIDWLDTNSLGQSIQRVAAERQARLEVIAEFKEGLNWPTWMFRQVEGEPQDLPGIIPLFVRSRETASKLAHAVLARTNVRVAVYHFDRSPSYISSEWSPCIAVPVHWQIPLDMLRWIVDFCIVGVSDGK